MYIPGVGNLRPTRRIRPAKQNHPARRPFTNCLPIENQELILL